MCVRTTKSKEIALKYKCDKGKAFYRNNVTDFKLQIIHVSRYPDKAQRQVLRKIRSDADKSCQ